MTHSPIPQPLAEVIDVLTQILDDAGYIAEYDANDKPVFREELPNGGSFCGAVGSKVIKSLAALEAFVENYKKPVGRDG